MNSENIYAVPQVVQNYHLSRNVPDRILAEYARMIVKAIGPGKHILDAGFGTGMTLIEFAKLTRTSGIDESLAMFAKVRSKLEYTGIEATLIEDNIEQIGNHLFEKVDAVHVKAVLHIPKYPYIALNALHNALKPGGYFILGKEFSQPEDNLEQIGNFPRQDIILKDFYDKYFRLRKEIGKPFVKPQMPAGDYLSAALFLIKLGYNRIEEISSDIWDKQLTFGELIGSIEKGTFTVHRRGLEDNDRKMLADKLRDYCQERSYPIDYPRFYEASLRALIMQKPQQNL